MSSCLQNEAVGYVRGQLEIAREVHLHAMPFANRDRRQAVQEPVHHLQRGLRRRIADAASDDHRPVVAVAASQAGAAEVLRQATDEPNGRSGAERREVVVIDPSLRPASPIWLRPMNWSSRYVRPSGISRRWNATASRVSPKLWTGFVSPSRRAPAGITTCCPLCEYSGFVTRQFTGAAVRPIESIRQNGIDERAFEDPVQRPGGADRTGSLGRTRLFWSGRTRSCASRLLDWGSRTGLSLHTVQPRCPRRCAERGVSDLVNGGCPSCGGHAALHRRLGPASIRSLRLRSPAQDDVAGKEALVLAAAPLRCDRIRRRRRGRLAVRSRVDNRRGLLRRQLRQRSAPRALADAPGSRARGRRSERQPELLPAPVGRAPPAGRPRT